MDRRNYKNRWLMAVLAAFLILSAGTTVHAALSAFSPTPALMPPGTGSPGVPIGGIPAWYQDITGVSVQPCLVPATCGLIGLGDPMFNEALPLSYPTNFPTEAFYSDVVAIFPVGTATARVVMAMEYTFIDAVTGALIGAPPRPANALGAPFQRQRLIISYPPSVPPVVIPVGGTFTVTHPWGVTTFTGPKCVNQAGGTKCSMTRDLPLPGAIPPSFAAALGTGVAGSQSTFLKDPLAPAGFLGSAVAVSAFTGAAPGSANSITVTDPLGNTGTTTSLTLLVGQLVGIPATPALITFPAQKPGVPVPPVTLIVTIANPDALNPATLGAAAKTGANAVDFTLIPGTPVDCLAGATLTAAGGASPSCTFGIQFSEPVATAVDGAKSAQVSFAVTAPPNMPPTLVTLAGAIDSIAPTVVLTLPTNGDQNWPANSRPHVTFSEPVTGVTSTTFIIKGPIVPHGPAVDIGGTVTLVGGTIADYALPIIAGKAELLTNETYTATLLSVITDSVGNPLGATATAPTGTNYVFSFTTTVADTVPPTVSGTTPGDNTTGARVADSITATFAGPVDPGDVNATTFFLSEGVTGSVTYDQGTRTAILKPDKPLQFFHKYTATIKGGAAGVTSLGQVPMIADKTWSFFTNGAPSAPDLLSPADGAAGVALPVQFQWIRAKDADGEPVSYHLWYGTNPAFLGVTPVDVAETATAASSSLRNTLAGLGGYGAGILLAGFAIVGGVRSRRKIFFFIAVLAISVMATAACGKKTETVAVPVGVDPATIMSKTVTGLKSGTTYYWKVSADDGNGAVVDSETRSFSTL